MKLLDVWKDAKRTIEEDHDERAEIAGLRVFRAGVAAVGPYFQNCAFAGSVIGYVMVTVTGAPTGHPEAVKTARPCGKSRFDGAEFAGGEAGSPVSGMNVGFAWNWQAPRMAMRSLLSFGSWAPASNVGRSGKILDSASRLRMW